MHHPATHAPVRAGHRASPSLWLIFLAIAAAACSRAVAVGSQPTPVFAVAVTNGTRAELIVAYDDGSGPKALGAVAPRQSERFIIASPARTAVQISGRSRDGSVTSGPHSVQLVAGSTTPVALN